MSPIAHGMIAWLIAILFLKELKDRRLVVFIGVVPDIDGIFYLFNQELYYEYHHTIGHSYIFGIVLCEDVPCWDRDIHGPPYRRCRWHQLGSAGILSYIGLLGLFNRVSYGPSHL